MDRELDKIAKLEKAIINLSRSHAYLDVTSPAAYYLLKALGGVALVTEILREDKAKLGREEDQQHDATNP